jgi:hypothetical protein
LARLMAARSIVEWSIWIVAVADMIGASIWE